MERGVTLGLPPGGDGGIQVSTSSLVKSLCEETKESFKKLFSADHSYKPFFPLLVPKQEEAVQLWAVWAIHHVCTKNPAR